jgi:hypothetical protein
VAIGRNFGWLKTRWAYWVYAGRHGVSTALVRAVLPAQPYNVVAGRGNGRAKKYGVDRCP